MILAVILTPNLVGVVSLYVQVELITNNGHEDELEYHLISQCLARVIGASDKELKVVPPLLGLGDNHSPPEAFDSDITCASTKKIVLTE